MRFNFECEKFGECLAHTELIFDGQKVSIWYGSHSDSKRVDYEIMNVSGARPLEQVLGGGAAEDAARIAIHHFVHSSGANHAVHRFKCTEITGRWSGRLLP